MTDNEPYLKLAADDGSDPNVEVIRAEIEQTRGELADTVDELARKLNLKSQVGTKVTAAKDKAGQTAQQVADQARPHLSKIALAGAGALMLVLIATRRKASR
jgi:hypothetical protein